MHRYHLIQRASLIAAIFFTPLLSSLILSVTASTSNNQGMLRLIVFSDVDGTIAHYPKHLQINSSDLPNDDNSKLIYLPASKTGTRGVLSKRTFELCHTLRHGSKSNNFRQTPLVLISGMRTTTLFQRLPYLPKADAYVSESGGRIYYPVPIDELDDTEQDGIVENLVLKSIVNLDQVDERPFALKEDLNWRKQISEINAAGLDGFQNTPINERTGKLWEYASHLMKRGYVLDTQGYATAFRINRKMQSGETFDNFDQFILNCRDEVPMDLGCSTNLGCIDVYPIMSGKKNCCEYLVKRFLGDNAELKMNAYCMCDDDNDIEMASACRTAFLPSVTSESIREMAESQNKDKEQGKLVIVEDFDNGIVDTAATERALEMILEELQQTK